MLGFKLAPSLSKRFFSSSSSAPAISNYLNGQIDSFLSNQSKNLNPLLQSHAFIITTGHSSNPFIASKLVSLYASVNQPNTSTKIFNSTSFKDPFLYNAIIKAHFDNGGYSQALEFFNFMRFSSALPNQFTIPLVVSACGELLSVNLGMEIHGLVSKLNLFRGNSAVASSFVYMYSKCGDMDSARFVFDEISVRDVVTWTALVIGFVQNGESEKGLEWLCKMHRISGDNKKPNFRTLEGGFQACGNLGALVEGKCIHGLSVKCGIVCYQSVQSSIFSMYSKCGAPHDACISFSEVVEKDLLIWTSIIGVHAKMDQMDECVAMFFKMQAAGIYPDGVVLSCLLSGFGNSSRVFQGKAFHGFILRRNFKIDVVVRSGLLSMYSSFGLYSLVEKLFDRRQDQEKEIWNMMVVGYGRAGEHAKSVGLFTEMQCLGIESDLNSLASVIYSCARLEATKSGRSLHCHVIKNSINENVSIANALIDIYGKSGNLNVARRIFCRIQKDIVTWNTLISSYVRSSHYFEALTLFDKMTSEGFMPNATTLVILLSACSEVASLEKGEHIHDCINKGGIEITLALATALIDMYAKCGQLVRSREIFDSIKEKDVVAWNVMISGYAMHGDVESAIIIFLQMEQADVTPNGLTFLALLSGCAHAGYVNEGKSLFRKMQGYSLTPNLKHYACMVDLLGRSGHLSEAEALTLSMPIVPDGEVWGALVNACKIHNNAEMGIRIAKNAIKSDPENDGYYVIISDLYSSLGMWEEVERVRQIMKEREVRKRAGWSTVFYWRLPQAGKDDYWA